MAQQRTLGSLIVNMVMNLEPLAKGLTKSTTMMQKSVKQLESIGTTLTTRLTVPLAAFGGASLKAGADFETVMARIRGLVGASQEQTDKWSKQLLEIAPKIGRAPTELALALEKATSAGQKGQKAIDSVTVAAKASVAGLGPVATVMTTVTSAMEVYKDANLEAADATDALAGAIKLGNFADPQSLTPAFPQVTGQAQALGISFQGVAAAMAQMSLTFPNAARVATQLSSAFTAIQKSSAESRKELKKANLSFEDLQEEIRQRGLAALIDFGQQIEANGLSMERVFGNSEAAKGMRALVKDTESARSKLAELKSGVKFTEDAFKESSQTLNEKLIKAVTTFDVLMVKVGKALDNEIIPVIEKVTRELSNLSDWFGTLDEDGQQFVVRIGLILGALGPLAIALSGIARSLGLVSTAMLATSKAAGLVVTGLGGVATTVATGGALAVGLAAINGMFSDVDKSLDDLEKQTEDVSDAIEDMAKHAEKSAKRARRSMEEFSKPSDVSAFAGRNPFGLSTEGMFGEPAKNKAAADNAKNELKGVGDQAKKAAADVDGTLAKSFGSLWETFADGVGNAGPSLMDFTENATSSFSGMVDQVLAEGNRMSVELEANVLARQRFQWASFADFIGHNVADSFATMFAEIENSENVFNAVLRGAKRFVLNMLDMITQQIIAQKAAAIAMSIASAPFSFGASLAAIPKIVGAVGPALLAISAAKAGIQGLSTGGLVTDAGVFDVHANERVFLPAGTAVVPDKFQSDRPIIIQNIIDGRVVAERTLRHYPDVIRSRIPGD